MEIVILAGNSIRNKDWAEELARNLKSAGTCYVQQYKHWQTGEKNIDSEYEIKQLVDYLKNKKDYILVGKSAGALIIIGALVEKAVSPIKCILMGVPFDKDGPNALSLMEAIASLKVRVEFVQNKEDPYCSAEAIKKMLESLRLTNYSFTETEGNTHEYTDYQTILNLF